MIDRNEYQQEYYEANKAEISERRKERYRSNPEVRARAIEASKQYRLKKRMERKKNKSLAPREKVSKPRKPVSLRINESTLKAYTITVLAERVGRSLGTINSWINAGIIPATPYRSSRGDRLYTSAMILAVKLAIQDKAIVRIDTRDDIIRGWKDAGINIE